MASRLTALFPSLAIPPPRRGFLLLSLVGCGTPPAPPEPAPPPPDPILREEIATVGDVGRITALRYDGGVLVVAGRKGQAVLDLATGAPGSFVPWPAPATGDASFVDLDGDGDLEVLVAPRADSRFFLVDPDTSITTPVPLDAPLEEALPIDVDGDGDLEIAVTMAGTDAAALFDHTGTLLWQARWSADVSSMQRLPGPVPHIVYVDGMSLVTRDATGAVVTRVRPTEGGIVEGLQIAHDLPGFAGPTLVVPHRIPGQGVRYDLFAPDGESPRGQLDGERIAPYLATGAFSGPGGRAYVHTTADPTGGLHVRFYDEAHAPLWTDHLEGPADDDAHALLVTDDAAWVGWGPRVVRYTRPAR